MYPYRLSYRLGSILLTAFLIQSTIPQTTVAQIDDRPAVFQKYDIKANCEDIDKASTALNRETTDAEYLLFRYGTDPEVQTLPIFEDAVRDIVYLRDYLQNCSFNPDRRLIFSEEDWSAVTAKYDGLVENGEDLPPLKRMSPYSESIPVSEFSDGTRIHRWSLTDSEGKPFQPIDIAVGADDMVYVFGASMIDYSEYYSFRIYDSEGTFVERDSVNWLVSSSRSLPIAVDAIAVAPNGDLYYSATGIPPWALYGFAGDASVPSTDGAYIDIVVRTEGGMANLDDSESIRGLIFESDEAEVRQLLEFHDTCDMVFDSTGNLYVSDAGTGIFQSGCAGLSGTLNDNGRASVRKFVDGSYAGRIGDGGLGQDEYIAPVGVSVDNKGYVYVADAGNNRIQKYDNDGTFVMGWGTNGTSTGQFSNLVDVAVDASNNVYVLDYHVDRCGDALPDHSAGDCYFSRIQKFTSGGTFLEEWDTGKLGDYYKPIELSSGSVYLLFAGNPHVFVIDSEGSDSSTGGSNSNSGANDITPTGTESQISEGSSQQSSSTSGSQDTKESGTELTGGGQSSDSSQSPASGGGCLIATAAYGSEFAPQVQMLREIRDNQLLKTSSGSAFMSAFNTFYYSWSPTVAEWERQNPAFKEAVRVAITPLIATLSILPHVSMDSEEEALGYGIGVILLNIGIYFIGPAFAIMFIRSRKRRGNQ